MSREYYHAYDARYRSVHASRLQWFADTPTPIVAEALRACGITPSHRILEIGCGEGRDAGTLLSAGYDVLATDVSEAAIGYCREKWPRYAAAFRVLDCLTDTLNERFDFICAVAVLHMLTDDAHRDGFCRFIQEHLKPGARALICTMGDGETERCTDPKRAFDLAQRTHQATGTALLLPATTCRLVSWQTLRAELARNALRIEASGITAAPPDFPQLMYALVTAE